MNAVQQGFSWSAPQRPADTRHNLVIEASAGTGKTTAIVAEVLKLMLDRQDLSPERIVLMTFTEKAAGEIAERIRGALEFLQDLLATDSARVQWPPDSADPLVTIEDVAGARRAVAHHLTNIDALQSQTIHSFCQSLLRRFPIEAGLDPQFRIIQGFERSLLYGQVYDAWIDHETRVDPRPDVVAEWELLFTHSGYLFIIRELILGLIDRRDLLAEEGYGLGDTGEVLPAVRGALEAVQRCGDCATDEGLDRLFRYVREVEPPENDDIDAWISWSAPIADATRKGDLRQLKSPILKEALKALRTDDAKGECLYDRLVSHRAAAALIRLTRRFVDWLDREKRKLGVADFDDLLLRTRALLDDETVVERARAQFDHIFVDEFQDTDRTQAAIIRRLATDATGGFVPGRLVIVGDPKQSIYGFRRADPQTYYVTAQEMLRAGAAERVIEKQYRSDPELIEPLNAVFSRLFPEQPHDQNVFRPKYQRIEAARPAARRRLDARFTMLQAPVDDAMSRHTSEAEAIAAWIHANRDRHGSDLKRFALLFRRTTILDDYLDVLRREGIEYVLPPTSMFLDRPAAVDLVGVLRAIAWPFDRGAQISAARSPYFGLTDREIADGIQRAEGRAQSAEEETGPEVTHEPWRDFQNAIDGFREASRHLPLSELVELVVRSCGIEDVYAAAADGVRHLRHLEHLRSIVFDFDVRSGGSVRQFVDEVQSRRRDPEEMEPVLADETKNAVRIMTVHAAKGLEFETVILPDLTFGGSGDGTRIFTVEEPRSLVVTGGAESISANFRRVGGEKARKVHGLREDAEMRRVFYVAVTRAMTDVVFVFTDPREMHGKGFFKCLTEVLALDKDALASMWPREGRELRETIIGPVAFEHAHETAAISLSPPAARDEGPITRRLTDPDLERRLLSSPLAAASIDSPPAVAERLPAGEIAAKVASGRRRMAGILLHRVLEIWDGTSESEALLRALALEAGVDAEAVALVRRRMETISRSPTFRRIADAETVGREMPVRFEENGAIVERRIDRLIRENGREIVVDYKSGAPEAARVARDRLQVARYAGAIRAITSRPCDALLWYIDLERDEVVEETMNDER